MAEESAGTRAAYGIAGAGGIPGCAHFIRIADDPEEEQSTTAPTPEPAVVERLEVADRE